MGYSGGCKEYPTYEEICKTNTGHYEVIRVLYDPNKISYEQITQYFFEIHDPTQIDGQGPDKGDQYKSVVFYYNEQQKKIATSLITTLQNKGLKVVTALKPVEIFWPAEKYHQDYYEKSGKQPYCHHYVKRFD